MSEAAELGFIGIGQMGRAMVENWLALGCRVRVYNRTREKILPLLEKGAVEASSPAEAAIPGGILVTCVADDAALGEIFREEAIFRRLGPDGIHVSMSTILPETATALAEKHRRLGGIYVAAPVMGRPDAVAARRQTYYLSGPAEAKQRVRPVLAAISRQVLDLGDDPAAAHVAKLASNFLIATVVESLGEAFTLVEKNGLPAKVFFDTITEFLFDCFIYRRYGEHILSGQFREPLFRLLLGLKDMQLLAQMAARSQTPMPFLGVLRDRYLSSLAQGRGDWDWTAIVLEIRRQAGLEPPAHKQPATVEEIFLSQDGYHRRTRCPLGWHLTFRPTNACDHAFAEEACTIGYFDKVAEQSVGSARTNKLVNKGYQFGN